MVLSVPAWPQQELSYLSLLTEEKLDTEKGGLVLYKSTGDSGEMCSFCFALAFKYVIKGRYLLPLNYSTVDRLRAYFFPPVKQILGFS